jgi:UDP-glucose 4-epimerase
VDDLGWPSTVEIFRADLRVAQNLEAAFLGVDVLIHLAAAIQGSDDLQFAATVSGTERLLEAMSRTRCRRLVLASSFAVYHRSAFRGELSENSPILESPDLYELDGYSIAKAWQERVTREKAREHAFQLTVLRPGFIWGIDHADISALGQKLGNLRLVIGPLTRIPMTHVENCADLFALAASDPRAVGQTFNVVDGPGRRVWSFLGEYLRLSGERGYRLPAPYLLVYSLVAFLYAYVFKRNPRLPHFLVPCRFQARLKPFHYSNAHAHKVLGWKPPLGHDACLARTFRPSTAEPYFSSAADPAPAP